jgi:hypothetical protein
MRISQQCDILNIMALLGRLLVWKLRDLALSYWLGRYTMGLRVDLQTILEDILGARHVYFQPPATISMVYPCIVYQRNNADTLYANNDPYYYEQQYQVTLIDKNPDTLILAKIAELPKCKYDRHYTADNLNHEVFTMYF